MSEDPWVQTVLAAERWLHHYSPGTRDQYRTALVSLTDYGRRHAVAPVQMTGEHLRGWMVELETVGNLASSRDPVPMGEAGLHRMSAAANSFLRRAAGEQPRVQRIKTRGVAPVKVKHLAPEVVQRVFAEAQIEGRHSEALVRLLLAGLRVSEAIRITTDDLTEDGVEVKDGRTASSHRVVPLAPETLRVLRRYPAGVPLVDGIGGANGRRHAHLAVAGLGERAGVKKLNPQMLTAYAISDMLARGIPLAKVQRIAGHRSLSSTVRYQRPIDSDPDAAATELLAGRFDLDEVTARQYIEALRSAGFLAH